MAIYQIDPFGDPRWAELTSRHPRAGVHTREWLAGLEQTYRFHPVVFTTCGLGKPLTDGVVCEPLYDVLIRRRQLVSPQPMTWFRNLASQFDQLGHANCFQP